LRSEPKTETTALHHGTVTLARITYNHALYGCETERHATEAEDGEAGLESQEHEHSLGTDQY